MQSSTRPFTHGTPVSILESRGLAAPEGRSLARQNAQLGGPNSAVVRFYHSELAGASVDRPISRSRALPNLESARAFESALNPYLISVYRRLRCFPGEPHLALVGSSPRISGIYRPCGAAAVKTRPQPQGHPATESERRDH